MRLIGNYSPPTTEDLIKLKEELGFTGEQMADLAGVSGNNQWRKYTGGKIPRVISLHILFYTLWISRCIATARERIPGSIGNYVTGVSERSQQRGNLKDNRYI
ncbi:MULTISPECIES: hypothetical protein [Photorhabdus]|uniref:hypothetical protein n=1 Tax=Photorhabdus TaxID=29487 RepID=UPI001864264F|nr:MULTISPECIES: hypothetical protein [Photorhabdus]MCC8382335.1 hypothetical protein [Photorhabdus laumondii]MCC8387167.1 hypothetical protein [Photorhabdus laumondii]MCC8411332.1 hypothetical protein [Photorhabdus laumondii]